MNKPFLLTLLSLPPAALASSAYAAPITLVKAGKPNATIVVQANAPQPIATAATDLQAYIAKISGVTLPLKEDGQEVAGINLNVGKTHATKDEDFPDATFNPETYAIQQRGGDLYFTGNYPTPTAFAVYSFLQDQLNVRWFAPGDDWEFVPRNTSGDLTVDVENVVKTPDFSPRVWSVHNMNEDWLAWNLRNKAVEGERVPRRRFQNQLHTLFPPSKFKDHPEYYPLVEGKRWIPRSDNAVWWWPCIGNPDVQRLTVEQIREYFDKNPTADSFSLGLDDIKYMCGCPLCLDMDSSPDDFAKRRFSDRYYKFVNIIAREIKKTHPDKYIGLLVYRVVRELPSQVDKLEDNVFGYMTQNSANWFNPELKKTDQELTREWAKRLTRLSRYDYFGFTSFAPRVYPRHMDAAIKFDKAMGFEGMYGEIYTFLPHTAPMIWSLAQLQWDSHKDIETLLDDFYSKMYPSTHRQMKQYFDLLEQSWNTPRPNHQAKSGQDWEFRSIIKQAASISVEDTQTGLKLLDEAYAAATTPVEKRRINVARQGLRYSSYATVGYDLARQLNAFTPQNAQQAQAGVKLIREFCELTSEREIFWAQAPKQQNLFGYNIRGFQTRKAFQPSAAALDAPAQSGIIRIAQWYYENQPAQAVQTISELLTSLPPGDTANILQALNWVASHKPASLVKNGALEAIQGGKIPASQTNESILGVPTGWRTWSSAGGAQYHIVSGRNASRATRFVAPPNGKSVLMQNVPVQAGKKYLATVWVKPTASEDIPHVSLALHQHTAKGQFTGKGAVRTTPATQAGWQQLMLWMTIPKEVTTISIQLTTRNGASAIFDDIAIYEVP